MNEVFQSPLNACAPTVPGDLEAEYRAIRSAAGMFDLSDLGKIMVGGPGAQSFLQSILTRNIDFLSPEQTIAALLLHEDGAVLADVILYHHDDHFIVETAGARRQAVLEMLEANRPAGVTVTDCTTAFAVIGVEGPFAWRVVQKLLDFDIAILPYKNFAKVTWQGHQVTVARLGYTAEYGYKLWVAPEAAPGLWQALAEWGTEFGLLPCGREALTVARTEVRFPDLQLEMRPETTPFEHALTWMVDFRKEFVGKEGLLARWPDQVKRQLVCFTAEGMHQNLRGNTVEAAGQPIGQVAHAVWSPGLGRTVGVAYLDQEFAAAGMEYATGPVSLKTVSAPMIYAKSLSVRMR